MTMLLIPASAAISTMLLQPFLYNDTLSTLLFYPLLLIELADNSMFLLCEMVVAVEVLVLKSW